MCCSTYELVGPSNAHIKSCNATDGAVQARDDEQKQYRTVTFLGWVFSLTCQLIYTYAPLGVHRTCRWADEIELTPITLVLNGALQPSELYAIPLEQQCESPLRAAFPAVALRAIVWRHLPRAAV